MMLVHASEGRPTIHAAARRHARPGRPARLVLSSAFVSTALAASLLAAVPSAAQTPQPRPAPPAPAAKGATPAPAPSTEPTGPYGVWFDDTGRGAVEIRPCGASLCGNIYWLQEPLKANGSPVTDANNPDSAKRVRPVCGLQVIGNVRMQPDGSWDEGWVYDPKVGKSYDVAIALVGNDRLAVTGYKGVKFLSKKFTWTRAPATLPRCDVTQAQTQGASGAPTGGAPVKAANQPAAAAKAQPPARAATVPGQPTPLPWQGRQ